MRGRKRMMPRAMDDFWGVTILLLVILTVLVAVFVRMAAFYRAFNLRRHPKARLSDRLPGLKTGDMILFIGHTHGMVNSLVTFDLFTHRGLVVRLGGELFISEATLDTLPNPETGVEERLPAVACLCPLLPRVRHYPGMVFLMALERPLTPAQEATLVARARVETPYPSGLQLALPLLGVPVHRAARHCIQHVAWLLDEAGLTPPGAPPLLETGFLKNGGAVLALAGARLGPDGGNAYGPVVELLDDTACGPPRADWWWSSSSSPPPPKKPNASPPSTPPRKTEPAAPGQLEPAAPEE